MAEDACRDAICKLENSGTVGAIGQGENRGVLNQRASEDVSDGRVKRESPPEDCSHVFLNVRKCHCPCVFSLSGRHI